jgi:hypothetical protein
MPRKVSITSDAVVQWHLRALRRLIEDDSTDEITRRIAYEVETAIRWAREPVVGWPSPVVHVKGGAALLRERLRAGSR